MKTIKSKTCRCRMFELTIPNKFLWAANSHLVERESESEESHQVHDLILHKAKTG